MRYFTLGFVLLALALVIGCGGEVAEPDWDYSGGNGPANWASLSEDYAACGEGIRQSPVDITGFVSRDGSMLSFTYRGESWDAHNDGRVAVVMFDEDNQLSIGDTTYHLKQAHMHSPSEHTLNGEALVAEMHLVHADDDGSLAVVGILYRLGAASPIAQALIDQAPKVGESVDGPTLDARVLEPAITSYYRYAGSKTTPPCDEPVDWYVASAVQTISQEQVDDLLELVGRPNNRPVQPLRGREIRLVGG